MQNNKILIILLLLTVFSVIILAGILYFRTDQQSNQTQKIPTAAQINPVELENSNNNAIKIIEESNADINTVGLIVYENNSFEKEALIYEMGARGIILLTVVNRNPHEVTFKIKQQPKDAYLPEQFSLAQNENMELNIRSKGDYTIQVEETDQDITLNIL